MARKGLGLAVAAAAAAVALSGRRRSSDDFIEPPAPAPDTQGKAAFVELVSSAPIDPDLRLFLTAKARRESTYNPSAHNDTPKERAASRRMLFGTSTTKGSVDRGFFQGNPYLEQIAEFGSGGYLGMLGPTGLAAGGTNGPWRKASPQVIFGPKANIVMAIDYAYRLTRWPSFQRNPTWEVLALGWASGSLMDDDDDPDPRIFDPNTKTARAVLQRFAEDLSRAGAPSGFARQRVRLGYGGDVRSLMGSMGVVA